MLNNQLKKQWAEMVAALRSSERFYAIDDGYATMVKLSDYIDDRLTARVVIYQKIEERRGDELGIDWDCIELDELPARLIGRVVETKMMVERWNANELDELPPSTTTNFLAEQEIRREARRRYRRR
jgi:hypothetical protein